jgi:hypothetical protein
MNEAHFFVGCNSESPEHIYFNMDDAVNAYHDYIELFDEAGNKIIAYKRIFDKDDKDVFYTTDF